MQVKLRWSLDDDVEIVNEADRVVADLQQLIEAIKTAQQHPEVIALYVNFGKQGLFDLVYEAKEKQ